MIKKIIAYLLIFAMAITVSACAVDNSRSAGSGENSGEAGISVNKEVDADKSDDKINENEGVAGGDAIGQNMGANEEEAAKQTGVSNGEPADQTGIVSGESVDRDTGTYSDETVDQNDGVTGGHTVEGAEADGNMATIKDGTDTALEPGSTANKGTEDATGKDDERVSGNETGSVSGKDSESRALEGRIICIDPGHQTRGNYDTEPVAPGSDEMKAKVSSGTAGVKTRVPEYKLVLEVALRLRDTLEKHGATVIMTRTENNVDISNAERAAIANDANADLYFRIHADGSTDKSVHGVSVLIPGRKYITDEYILKESEKAGSCILDSFVKSTGAKKRGLVKRNDLSGFNWCSVPMALIEIGFMSNADEDAKLNTSEYQDKMVEGMAEGIIRYFAEKS